MGYRGMCKVGQEGGQRFVVPPPQRAHTSEARRPIRTTHLAILSISPVVRAGSSILHIPGQRCAAEQVRFYHRASVLQLVWVLNLELVHNGCAARAVQVGEVGHRRLGCTQCVQYILRDQTPQDGRRGRKVARL